MTVEERLVELGIASPRRAFQLIREARAQLELDLSGLVVVTEAGTGVYALTPVIAAMAGAEDVRAITRNSSWGSAAAVEATVNAACEMTGVSGRVKVTAVKEAAVFSGADIVTNLGFVRPIDTAVVDVLKPTAVVPLMCEAWEMRPGDVDVEACRRRGILVLGTNEDHPSCNVFRFAGPLAGRILFEAGFELLGTRVAVIGSDRFAPTIVQWLASAGAVSSQVHPARPDLYERVAETDVLMVAEYASDGYVVGEQALIDVARLQQVAPSLTVIQFAGAIDERALSRYGINFWPESLLPPRRMVRTFSSLGAAPVVRLHAAGLKVGELGARARMRGLSFSDVESSLAAPGQLAQRIPQMIA